MGNQTRVTGSEMVVPYTSSGATFDAYELATQFITAGSGKVLTLTGTWLARQASLFNKYKFDRITLRYVPFCPTTTQGRLVIAWTGDSDDNLPTSAQQVSQYQNSVEGPVWRELSCNAMISRTPEFIVHNERTGSANYSGIPLQGSFIFGADNGPSTSLPVGTFYLDYDVRFWSRAPYSVND